MSLFVYSNKRLNVEISHESRKYQQANRICFNESQTQTQLISVIYRMQNATCEKCPLVVAFQTAIGLFWLPVQLVNWNLFHSNSPTWQQLSWIQDCHYGLPPSQERRQLESFILRGKLQQQIKSRSLYASQILTSSKICVFVFFISFIINTDRTTIIKSH